MEPVVDGLQPEYADSIEFVVYIDVNTDENVAIFAADQGVVSAPTMVLVSPEGTELGRWEGEIPESMLRASFDASL